MVTLLAILPSISRSQSATFIGIEARLHRVYHSGGFRAQKVPAPRPYEDGTGFGQSLGVYLERRFTRSFGISTTLSYNNLPGTFEQRIENPRSIPFEIEPVSDGTPSDPGDTIVRYNAVTNVDYRTLSLEILGRWRPFVKDSTLSIGLTAGPTLDYVILDEAIESLHLITPVSARLAEPENNSIRWDNSGRQYIHPEKEILSARELLFGLRTGLFAEFGNLNSGIVVSPGLFFYTGLTNVTSAENWSLRTLTGQISVMIGL